mmetsp:Transcript_122111/g.345318  ORF Transcript_122111/g.345318 Transcript_122111/m.345318 type:complete len:414 (-) Transcript_122111:135-1376(-)
MLELRRDSRKPEAIQAARQVASEVLRHVLDEAAQGRRGQGTAVQHRERHAQVAAADALRKEPCRRAELPLLQLTELEHVLDLDFLVIRKIPREVESCPPSFRPAVHGPHARDASLRKHQRASHRGLLWHCSARRCGDIPGRIPSVWGPSAADSDAADPVLPPPSRIAHAQEICGTGGDSYGRLQGRPSGALERQRVAPSVPHAAAMRDGLLPQVLLQGIPEGRGAASAFGDAASDILERDAGLFHGREDNGARIPAREEDTTNPPSEGQLLDARAAVEGLIVRRSHIHELCTLGIRVQPSLNLQGLHELEHIEAILLRLPDLMLLAQREDGSVWRGLAAALGHHGTKGGHARSGSDVYVARVQGPLLPKGRVGLIQVRVKELFPRVAGPNAPDGAVRKRDEGGSCTDEGRIDR